MYQPSRRASAAPEPTEKLPILPDCLLEALAEEPPDPTVRKSSVPLASPPATPAPKKGTLMSSLSRLKAAAISPNPSRQSSFSAAASSTELPTTLPEIPFSPFAVDEPSPRSPFTAAFSVRGRRPSRSQKTNSGVPKAEGREAPYVKTGSGQRRSRSHSRGEHPALTNKASPQSDATEEKRRRTSGAFGQAELVAFREDSEKVLGLGIEDDDTLRLPQATPGEPPASGQARTWKVTSTESSPRLSRPASEKSFVTAGQGSPFIDDKESKGSPDPNKPPGEVGSRSPSITSQAFWSRVPWGSKNVGQPSGRDTLRGQLLGSGSAPGDEAQGGIGRVKASVSRASFSVDHRKGRSQSADRSTAGRIRISQSEDDLAKLATSRLRQPKRPPVPSQADEDGTDGSSGPSPSRSSGRSSVRGPAEVRTDRPSMGAQASHPHFPDSRPNGAQSDRGDNADNNLNATVRARTPRTDSHPRNLSISGGALTLRAPSSPRPGLPRSYSERVIGSELVESLRKPPPSDLLVPNRFPSDALDRNMPHSAPLIGAFPAPPSYRASLRESPVARDLDPQLLDLMGMNHLRGASQEPRLTGPGDPAHRRQSSSPLDELLTSDLAAKIKAQSSEPVIRSSARATSPSNPSTPVTTTQAPAKVEQSRPRSISLSVRSSSPAAWMVSERSKRSVEIGAEPRDSLDRPQSEDGANSHFVLGVIGPPGVGKSTLVHKALRNPASVGSVIDRDDRRPIEVTTYNLVVQYGGRHRSIKVIEIDQDFLEDDSVSDAGGIIWPAELPRLDGALLCFDASNQDGLGSLGRLLRSFWRRGGMSVITVACKASKGDDSILATCEKAAELTRPFGTGIIVLDGGTADREQKARGCFNWLTQDIRRKRGEPFSNSRESFAFLHSGRTSGESRSSSPSTTRKGFVRSPSPLPEDPTPPSSNPFPVEDVQPFLDMPPAVSTGEGPPSAIVAARKPTKSESTGVASSSLASIAENLSTSVAGEDGKEKQPARPPREGEMDLYFDGHVLIDKFVYAAVAGNDAAFIDAFLIIYRRFATPRDVLTQLLARYELAVGNMSHTTLLSRFVQIKICHILLVWTETYPGDFGQPQPLDLLGQFRRRMFEDSWTIHLGVELVRLLKGIPDIFDPETSWALPMSTETLCDTPEPPRPVTCPPSNVVINKAKETPPSQETTPKPTEDKRGSSPRVPPFLRSRSGSDAYSAGGSGTRSLPSTAGTAKIGGQTLLDFSNHLLLVAADEVALQISRLEWDIFADIKPRDLIRHVLAPRDPKNPRVALHGSSAVSRSTDLFNHLAVWTASMILVQTKLKARAKVLLKLMKIAYELRDMDDFHSLMGVLAGIASQPVHRLEATFEGAQNLDSEAYRRYQSLTRLMSSAKSYTAYKLARHTASAQCIPYLGVHLQEIIAINEVKSDMRDGKVNWTKASQLSKAASTVMFCARFAPDLPTNEAMEHLILRAPVLDEDGLYDLTYRHKARGDQGNTSGRPSTKKLRQLISDVIS